ncbi:hypothetical protein Taro_007687 [Colocasia esculenta]|uniref:Uncharacterized protein n=1 Tax=Colocasia esculenta TaxID=4460 RepID=A0A843TZN8_COLES|nr:hypothetical protein [Colocasia esculenta]
MAPEPPREAGRRTVVRLDYGGYCCVLCAPTSTLTRRGGRVRSVCVASRVVVTTYSSTEFSTAVRLLSSGRARVRQRRQSGSRHPHS